MTQLPNNTRNLRGDIVFAFMLCLACYLAWLVRDVLMLVYVSALFAVVLSPVVRATAQFRIGRWQPFKGSAIFFLLVGVAAALIAFGFLALPPVIRDLQEFGREMPTRLPNLLAKLKTIPFADRLNTDEISSRVQDYASKAATYLLYSIGDWAGKVFNIAMGFILTVYFILEGEGTYRWFFPFFRRRSGIGLTRPCDARKFAWGNGWLGRAA